MLEANDNPYAVEERFPRDVIDEVFNRARIDLEAEDLEGVYWARMALHLGHYFAKIGQNEMSNQYYAKADTLGAKVPNYKKADT